MHDVRKTHRIGLLTPSSNTTQEPEFSSVLPSNVSLHTGRLSFSNIDASTMLSFVEELEHESRKLADADVVVIILSATTPAVRGGKGYDQECSRRLQIDYQCRLRIDQCLSSADGGQSQSGTTCVN